MDLASVVAALASVGVRVSGSTPNSSVQVDSSRACPTGLAGPEPSGTINDPGQHFQVRVKWTDECEEAFHHLKAALCEVATLHVPKFDRPFYIRTDASRYAIGAVLEQVDEATGDHYPLAFWSRKLAPRQMQWSPREQETYAIICALKKYQSWVGTNRVEVLTDHRSLEYWATEHIDTVASPAGRRARWHEFLSLFDLHVSYLPGKHNTVADALSRWAYPASEGLQSTNIHGTEQDRQS